MGDGLTARTSRRWTVLVVAAVIMVVAVLLSLSVGSNRLPVTEVWDLLLHPDGSTESAAIHGQRLPRTAVAVAVGAALGLAGALMQSLTRNPLADPGILGINAGASLTVVLAVAVTGLTGIWFYLWFAFAGAAVTSVGVYLLAGTGRHSATPARLALAGVAVSAALVAITQTVILADQQAFNEFRLWVAGSLEGRGWTELSAITPFLLVGLVIAVLIGPALNALGLGDETGRALGVRVPWTRSLAMVAVTLLCGAATAAVGPIAFVGLAVPMLTRAAVGHDLRWMTPLCLLLGASWLLVADTLARVVTAQEVAAGVIAALLGGPVFVAVVRRRKVPAL
ncbi:FecCD family ABC transporter permease [Nocardioides insulae]|uniref:FecCD family ABC transporter permease n=1 Tax=Nocardioides insulae TaxID=394734 RepID=UPI00041300C9|nr:iron ABC transporter permease [Nocardioides insulae]